MKRPPILYKYRSIKDALHIIKGQSVKISPPSTFNDPFELSPRFPPKMQIQREKFLAYLLKPENVKRSYEIAKEKAPHEKLGTLEEYTEAVHAQAESIYRNLDQTKLSNTAREFIDKIRSTLLTFCLSEPANDILMWAHYADNHAGLVIGFSTVANEWGLKEKGFKKVQYKKTRPAIDMNVIAAGSNPVDVAPVLEKVFTTKSPHWEYEGEYRCFYKATTPNIETITPKKGSPLYFRKIRQTQIREIIFGWRCPTIERVRICVQAHAHGFKNIRYRQATLHPTLFKIVISDYI